ncbi:MAG: DUF3426 domain-containing protein [Aquabacterium sp.]|nr:DUF3426 domain-containing protein [Aquabacterium sp.]
MSLATRCTHCGTIFKVVQDQLKISDGWVRCGRCDEVFNALPALFDLETEAPPPRLPPPEPEADALVQQGLMSEPPAAWEATQPAAFAMPTPRALVEDDLALDPTPIEATTEFELDTELFVDDNTPLEDVIAATTPGRRAVAPPPADVPSTEEEDALDSRYLIPSPNERKAPHRRDTGPEFADAQFPTDAHHEVVQDWADEPALGAPEEDIAPIKPSRFGDDFMPERAIEPPSLRKGRPGTRGQDPAQRPPEFLKRAQRQAFWRHAAVRSVLTVLSLCLILLMGLQVAHQFRDLIAAHHPASRPLLAQWCQAVGCQISLPMRLEELQIESIPAFVRVESEGPDSYRLDLVVHNRSAIDLAWPHVDLILSDDAGAVIARRALNPHEAQWADASGTKSGPKPEGAPSRRSITLQWHLRAIDLHPVSYTAELFYP